MIHEHADDTWAGFESQFAMPPGNAVAVDGAVVYVVQKLDISGKRMKARRQLSGWQSRCPVNFGGVVVAVVKVDDKLELLDDVAIDEVTSVLEPVDVVTSDVPSLDDDDRLNTEVVIGDTVVLVPIV